MNHEVVGKWMLRASWPTAVVSGIGANALGLDPGLTNVPEFAAILAPTLVLGLGGLAVRDWDK